MDIIICNEKPGGGQSVENFLRKIPDLNIVFGLTKPEEIIAATQSQSFDICVIGARSLNWWKNLRPELGPIYDRLGKQVVMAHVLSAEYLVKSYWLGMSDVLYSSLSLAEIVRRCVDIQSGHRNISEVETSLHLRQFMSEDSVFRFLKDQWDVEIMMHLVEGRTNEEISDLVHMAAQTVRNRISRLINEAGVQNRTQLAILMVR